MTSSHPDFSTWRWLNEPARWALKGSELSVVTDDRTDFWRQTWYGFDRHSGHVFGRPVDGDFTFQLRIDGTFTTLYDQAGLMLLKDEHHWLKAGIEQTDGQPMIGSVLTAPQSDWATGLFPGEARRFWLRLTLTGGWLRLQYSRDGTLWPLLRLCPFPPAARYFVGAMCCTPERAGLHVTFAEMTLSPPLTKTLHDLS